MKWVLGSWTGWICLLIGVHDLENSTLKNGRPVGRSNEVKLLSFWALDGL